MNKRLVTIYWALIIVVGLGSLMAIQAGISLWRQEKVNQYIAEPIINENKPEHPMAKLALAETAVNKHDMQLALDVLTETVTTQNDAIRQVAYYNRANINLQQALQMQEEDPKRLPLIELAKQDYRSALALAPMFWNARYNLEIALNVVPELPTDDGLFEKEEMHSQRSIEAVGFRVELP